MFDSSFDRKTAIGASEAAAILGLSPYETQWDVFLRKTGQAPEFSDSVYTRAGDALEPLIGQLYEERAKERIWPVTKTERHGGYHMIAATPDWLVENRSAIVEGKAVMGRSAIREYGDEESGRFPERHAVQAMIQMAVFNREETSIAALVDYKLRVYRVERDKDTEARMLDTLADWWRTHVEKGDPPAMDGSPAAKDWLLRKFPKNTGQMLVADPVSAATMTTLIRARELQAVAERQEEIARGILCQLIADKDGIEAPGIGRVTWKRTKDSQKTDWDCVANTLAKFAPEGEFDKIVEMHTTTKPGTRRFVVTEEKDNG